MLGNKNSCYKRLFFYLNPQQTEPTVATLSVLCTCSLSPRHLDMSTLDCTLLLTLILL